MTDLTKITTPFGLLDAETQEALKAHGGPYEFWHWAHNDWRAPDGEQPGWNSATVYRVKIAPPKPRELTGVWNSARGCFEIHVTNADYPHLMAIRLTGVLP